MNNLFYNKSYILFKKNIVILCSVIGNVLLIALALYLDGEE